MTIDCFNAIDELVQLDLPTDGTLTPQLRWVLLNGHCHSFALAIHRLTNWPMVGRIAHGEIEHVFCQMPDGTLVDAEGATKYPEELFDLSSDLRFQVLPPGFEFIGKDGWLKSVEDRLSSFAQARLEELKREDCETFHATEYPFWKKSSSTGA